MSHDKLNSKFIVQSATTDSTSENTMEEEIVIRPSKKSDINTMVSLSNQKRWAYEKAKPQFWKMARNADSIQHKWFIELLDNDDYIMLCSELDSKVTGFIIGQLICTPGVYDPGGLTLMIDDFCVEQQSDWQSVGTKLLNVVRKIGITKGAIQVLVVCGAHDERKRRILNGQNLSVTSEWYVGKIN